VTVEIGKMFHGSVLQRAILLSCKCTVRTEILELIHERSIVFFKGT